MKVLFTLSIIGFSIVAMAEQATAPNTSNNNTSKVYKHVSEDGVVEFSDRPDSHSEQITVPKVNSYQAVKIKPDNSKKQAPLEVDAVIDYKISISSPTANQTLRSNNGDIAVSVSISPTLQVDLGHKIELYMDGKSKGKQTAVSFRLQNVDRGQHSLVAQIISRSGQVLYTSKPVTFNIQRFSLLNKRAR